ncbi:response regulator [Actinoplanes solisilvae]|uniref:response regulator n=1 Tax=Actinoplanes solisilvae TaxID=2486853 RepID=UPI000FD891EC|nr:response regulator [Actinoplanes solisilvae]
MSAPATPVVLVVDDDLDFLDTMTHQLGVRGFRVLTAPDSESAMTVCEQEGDAIDVLIADLSLPGDLNGSLARRVSAAYPTVKIVYATGVPRHIAVATGLVPPTAPYLEKPVSADILSGLMRSLIRR